MRALMMRRLRWLLILIPLCAASMWGAEKTKAELAEDAEAAEEERWLEKRDLLPEDGYEFEQVGKLLLNPRTVDETRPSVVGVFLSRGRTYQVKTDGASVLKRLGKFNGKVVRLGGKVRNSGKYLIVQDVLSQPGKGIPTPSSNSSPARM